MSQPEGANPKAALTVEEWVRRNRNGDGHALEDLLAAVDLDPDPDLVLVTYEMPAQVSNRLIPPMFRRDLDH